MVHKTHISTQSHAHTNNTSINCVLTHHYNPLLTNKYTLISNSVRVYKGGSWADRAYWLSPGTRRFMEEERSSRTVGFRCAMISMGGDSSGSQTRGEENRFGSSPKKRRRSRR